MYRSETRRTDGHAFVNKGYVVVVSENAYTMNHTRKYTCNILAPHMYRSETGRTDGHAFVNKGINICKYAGKHTTRKHSEKLTCRRWFFL